MKRKDKKIDPKMNSLDTKKMKMIVGGGNPQTSGISYDVCASGNPQTSGISYDVCASGNPNTGGISYN
jgi:hypothetical protein